MNWRVWGPLFFATVLFVIASAIKIIAFAEYSFYIDLAPELSLWATGVLFSLAVSEHVQFGGRMEQTLRRTSSGGIEIHFRIALPAHPEFTPRMIYLFVFAMAIWILNVLFAGKAEALLRLAEPEVVPAATLILVGLLLAGFSVGASLRALQEVG